jgi:hypothetical protein
MFRTSAIFSVPRIIATLVTLVLGLSLAPSALAEQRKQHAGSDARLALAAIPNSVTTPIQRALEAMNAAKEHIDNSRYTKAVDALGRVRSKVKEANTAGMDQIGAPPSDPEEDEPPGPASVIAVIKMEHKVGVASVKLFKGLRKDKVVKALRATLWVTHTRRDEIIDAVIALSEEELADYSDGMADILPIFKQEIDGIQLALDEFRLTAGAREGLENALARVRATRTTMKAAFGGGE